MKQCVFYDVMLGFTSMDTLAKAPDLWAAIGPGSPARSQKYAVRQPDGTVTSSIRTCRDSYGALTNDWTTMLNALGPLYAKTLYPKLSNAAAAAKLSADLPVTYQAFTNNSSNALDIMRQHLAIGSFMRARDDMSGGAGAASIDSFAASRADLQAQNTYSAIAQGAMKWVPVLNIVLTVVFYAMFAVVFPLFLMPKTGVSTLIGYTTGFFYLAAWGPIYVVLHMILMTRSFASGIAVANGGVTLGSYSGIGAVNDETALLAGYLIASVPFIAAGLARGATAIAGQATSFLAPSQNAAEAAALEATTGNYAYGNASLANANINSRSTDQWTTVPSHFSGGATSSFREANGAFTTHNPDGSVVINQGPAISSLERKPTLSQGAVGELRSGISHFESQAHQERELSAVSTSAALTAGRQLFNTVQTSQGRDSITGRSNQEAISQGISTQRGWSDRLVKEQGWSRESADDFSRRAYYGGEVGVNAALSGGIKPEVLGVGGGISGGATTSGRSGSEETRNTRGGESASQRISKGLDFLKSESSTSGATASRESFFRATASSSDAKIRGLTQRRDASLTEANSHSVEASASQERGQRYQRDLSFAETHGYQLSRDLSQNLVAFEGAELARNPGLQASGYQTYLRDSDLTPAQRGVRERLEDRFQQSYIQELRDAQGPITPLGEGSISAPTNSAGSVRRLSQGQQSTLDRQAPAVTVGTDERDPSVGREVSADFAATVGRIDSRERGATDAAAAIEGHGGAIASTVLARHNAPTPFTNPIVDGTIGPVGGPVNAIAFARSHGVSIKPGTNVKTLDPALLPVISGVSSSSRSLGLTAPTITSAQDRHHHPGSQHPHGKALDFRGNNLTIAQGQALAGSVQGQLGKGYFVNFETFPQDPSNNHLHVNKRR